MTTSNTVAKVTFNTTVALTGLFFASRRAAKSAYSTACVAADAAKLAIEHARAEEEAARTVKPRAPRKARSAK